MIPIIDIRTDAEIKVEEIRNEWISSLPNQIDNETLIDKISKSITDKYGNRIMGLPSMPVENIAEWFDSKYRDDIRAGE